MGSGYSDLNLYLKKKYENNQASNNGQTDKYTITTSKKNYEVCSNFERVTHTIEFKPPENGTYYNVLLYNGDKDDKSDYIFGYYYPDKSKVLKEVHVYYSVLAPNDPLIISFVIKSGQTYNFSYTNLKNTRWCKAYNITYYSLNHPLSTEDLTNEFKKLRFNRKIQFVLANTVLQVSGSNQTIGKNGNYRYVFTPKGEKSVLGSDCLFKLNSQKNEPECPKTNKPQAQAQTQTNENGQPNSSFKNNNQIDPYYLDSVKNQFFDGIMVYFAKEENSKKPAQNGKNGDQNNNGNQVNVKKNEDDIAVLLEFVNNCGTKKFIKRKDKHGYLWAECKIEYTDDTKLNEQLTKIKSEAEKDDMTTFILEKKNKYNGVSEVKKDEQNKNTYTKYTHSATATNKPNLLFRKKETKIGKLETTNLKTKTLDVYFLKVKGKEEEDYPFLLVFTNEDENKSPAKSPPEPPPPSETSKTKKTCYHFSNTYEFNDWQELTADEAPEEKKEGEQNGLEKKLEEKLKKIETNGSCAQEIHHLRNIAYYILIGEEPQPAPPPPEKKKNERPKVLSSPKVHGPGVVQILGYVTAGLVVKGTIGGGLYGIYWYNTTIKLLT